MGPECLDITGGRARCLAPSQPGTVDGPLRNLLRQECNAGRVRQRTQPPNGDGVGPSLQSGWARSVAISAHGWPSPPLPVDARTAVDQAIRTSLEVAATPPQARKTAPLPRWTLKRLVAWVRQKFGIDCCRETLRQVLKDLGFSWKKARKLLNKADPKKRAAFLEQLDGLLKDALEQRCLLVYIDEAHIHLDTDEGYGWSIRGERFWVSSSSPGRAKVSFYGLYIYDLAQVRIWPYDRANTDNTLNVLDRLRSEFPGLPIKLVWDGASYHRSTRLKEAVETLDIALVPLPGYSPDFMPVEHLWHWLREEVTYHTCYDSKADLIRQVQYFQQSVNEDPIALSQRLWVKTQLDPEVEKLRIST